MCAKMGRPKLDNPRDTQIAVRLDKGTLAKLDEIAKSNSLTRAQVVRQSVEFLYKHIKK